MERLKPSEQVLLAVQEGMTSNHTLQGCEKTNPLIKSGLLTAESHPPNKKTTSKDSATTCAQSTKTSKLSKMSDQVSTSKGKALKPFWNEQCKENASLLWLPTETDSADLDLTSSSKLLKGLAGKSWFSTSLSVPLNRNSQQTYLPYCTYFQPVYTDLEVTKTRLNRVYPTKEQKALFSRWIGTSRFVYNTTVELLNQLPEGAKTPNWMSFWKDVVAPSLPEWCKDTPFQIKKIATKDAISALKAGKSKVAKKQIQRFSLSFRSRKDSTQSCYIPSSALRSSGIYPKLSGTVKFKESLPETPKDSRLVCRSGKFYLAVPSIFNVSPTENQGGRVVSIDPGVRTFHTFYAGDVSGKLGSGDFSRIQRLAAHLDNLISRSTKVDKKRKIRMLVAADRMREKIRNLVDELHHKVARFYVDNFDVILLPKFETQSMSRKAKRRISRKSVRAMLTFSHYRFAQFLKHKAFETGKVVVEVCEAFTSKTHPQTGRINNIGSAKRIKLLDGTYVDRDITGAFNIMLKALVDSPDQFKLVAVNES